MITNKHFTMPKDTEVLVDQGTHSIIPPAPQNPYLDSAPNRLSRTIAQIWTGYWLYAPCLKRVRNNRDEEISDKCWWCSKSRMSRTLIFLRCTHTKLEQARKDIWDWPDKEGIIMKRPAVGQLLGEIKMGKSPSRPDYGH
jgi:hypothetical protein